MIRWVDQGASQALSIFTVPERLISGQVETQLKAHISDKTNWRKMLSGEPEMVDLHQVPGMRSSRTSPHLDTRRGPIPRR